MKKRLFFAAVMLSVATGAGWLFNCLDKPVYWACLYGWQICDPFGGGE